jgi:aryl-alcohol dehydrogenase-like predicted oxidoreductase
MTVAPPSPDAPPACRLDDYRLLGRSGIRISPLCLGAMTFGTDWGWGADAQTSRAIFDAYAERGGNFIDTANFYTKGTSERLVGEFIAGDRERFVVATKYTLNTRPGENDPNAGGNHRKNMVQSVEASLRRLGTDYIDLYWVHAWDFATAVDEVMRGLDDLVRAGKVLALGVSDTPAWKVAQANTIAELRGWSRFVAIQVAYHLALRDVERDLLPLARELDLAVLAWAPLAGGILTGKYTREDLAAQAERDRDKTPVDPFDTSTRVLRLTEKKLEIAETVKAVADEIGRSPAQVAINWLCAEPRVIPMLGARSLAHIEDNLAAIDFVLTEEQRTRLDSVSRIELGFPHDFLRNDFVRGIVSGGARIDSGTPYTP